MQYCRDNTGYTFINAERYSMDTKKKLAQWMKDCMAQNNWTADEWARQAKTSATNITRFIKDQEYTPSGRVLDRLAGVCSIPLPLGDQAGFQISGNMVPIIEVGKNTNKIETLKKRSTKKVTTLVPVNKESFAVKIDTDRMSMGGILPDDVIICEPTRVRKPKHNCIIVYHTPHGGVEAGRWFPPFLMPQSTNQEHEPIKMKDVGVLGIAIQQIRFFA